MARTPKAENKTPQSIMLELGVLPEHWKTPLEFLLAVVNSDLVAIGGEKEPSLSQRIDASRIAANYVHQKLPQLVEQSVTHSWGEKIKEGETRIEKMRKNESGEAKLH